MHALCKVAQTAKGDQQPCWPAHESREMLWLGTTCKAVGRHASTARPSLNNGTFGLSNGTFAWPFRPLALDALGQLS